MSSGSRSERVGRAGRKSQWKSTLGCSLRQRSPFNQDIKKTHRLFQNFWSERWETETFIHSYHWLKDQPREVNILVLWPGKLPPSREGVGTEWRKMCHLRVGWDADSQHRGARTATCAAAAVRGGPGTCNTNTRGICVIFICVSIQTGKK